MWNPRMVISGVRWVTPSELSSIEWQNLAGRRLDGEFALALMAIWRSVDGSMMEPELNIGPTVTPVADFESQGENRDVLDGDGGRGRTG